MRKNLTEIVFILDRSGSMSGLERDTIGGFNSMIEQQKKAEGEALISTVLFDNVSEVLHDRVNVKDIRPMTDRDYTVRGCTALLDAIGGAFHHIGNVHKYARPEDVPEHTMFVITTDGMENASRRYDSEKVKQMIERQKEKYGWEFLFLGANIDAVETASQFGIGADRARRAVRLDGRHVGHHPGSRHPRLDAERTAVLDRRGHDRHVGPLLARHAARRVQRLGPRRGVAPDQPHDAGSTARAGQRGPLVGGPHLPRSGVERHRVGALLRLPDPRTARLTHR